MDFLSVKSHVRCGLPPCIPPVGRRHRNLILCEFYESSKEMLTQWQMFMDASESSRNEHMVRAVGVRLAGSALVDTVISVAMTYFVSFIQALMRFNRLINCVQLLRSRAQALGPMTNVMTRRECPQSVRIIDIKIDIVVRLTVETGTITVVAAIVDLIFYLKEHNGLHQVSGVVLCKLYSNTLMVLFNNRLVDWNKTQHAVTSDTAVSFRVDRLTTTDACDFPLGTVDSGKGFMSMEHGH